MHERTAGFCCIASAAALLALQLGCAGVPEGQLARCASGPPQRTLATLGDAPALAGDPARGAARFAEACTKCHSRLVVERASRLFRGYPRLDCNDYLTAVSDGYLTRVIAQGGLAVGLDKAMQPFAEQLTPEEIGDIIAYLRNSAKNL